MKENSQRGATLRRIRRPQRATEEKATKGNIGSVGRRREEFPYEAVKQLEMWPLHQHMKHKKKRRITRPLKSTSRVSSDRKSRVRGRMLSFRKSTSNQTEEKTR